MDTFEELFEETLRDIYYAEKAILKALPKMAKKATSKDLAAAFTARRTFPRALAALSNCASR